MFITKTWIDRLTEYPGRRKLTATGTPDVYDVEREEGLISAAGDAFSAANMNDLESRIGDAIDDITVSSLGAAKSSSVVTATLLANEWSGDEYTLEVLGVTSVSIQEILPALAITEAQLEALQGANIQDGGQDVDEITLKAFGTVPDINIPIRIVLRGDIYA